MFNSTSQVYSPLRGISVFNPYLYISLCPQRNYQSSVSPYRNHSRGWAHSQLIIPCSQVFVNWVFSNHLLLAHVKLHTSSSLLSWLFLSSLLWFLSKQAIPHFRKLSFLAGFLIWPLLPYPRLDSSASHLEMAHHLDSPRWLSSWLLWSLGLLNLPLLCPGSAPALFHASTMAVVQPAPTCTLPFLREVNHPAFFLVLQVPRPIRTSSSCALQQVLGSHLSSPAESWPFGRYS